MFTLVDLSDGCLISTVSAKRDETRFYNDPGMDVFYVYSHGAAASVLPWSSMGRVGGKSVTIPRAVIAIPAKGQGYRNVSCLPWTSRPKDRFGNKECYHLNIKGMVSYSSNPLTQIVPCKPITGMGDHESGSLIDPDLCAIPVVSKRYSGKQPTGGPAIFLVPGMEYHVNYDCGHYYLPTDLTDHSGEAGVSLLRFDVTWPSSQTCTISWHTQYVRKRPEVYVKYVEIAESQGSSVIHFSDLREVTSRTAKNYGCTHYMEYHSLHDAFALSADGRSGNWETSNHWTFDDDRWNVYLSPISEGDKPPFIDYLYMKRYLEEDFKSSNPDLDMSEVAEQTVNNIRVVKTNMITFAGDVIELRSLFKGIFKSLKKLPRDPRALAELYLSFHYGLELFVQDVHTISQSDWEALTKPSYEIRTAKARSPVQEGVGTKLDLRWNTQRFLKLYYQKTEDSDPLANLAWQAWTLGTAPSPDQLWDLVPFSFVADWFVKVQDALESDTTNRVTQMLTQLSCICTFKASAYVDGSKFSGLGLSGPLTASVYHRRVQDTLPPMSTRLNTATSFDHWFEGSALLVALNGKHR